jgi:hypothetical protein
MVPAHEHGYGRFSHIASMAAYTLPVSYAQPSSEPVEYFLRAFATRAIISLIIRPPSRKRGGKDLLSIDVEPCFRMEVAVIAAVADNPNGCDVRRDPRIYGSVIVHRAAALRAG